MRCAECGDVFVKTDAPIEIDVHGKTVNVSGIEHMVCEGCGNEAYRADVASKLQRAAHEAWRETRAGAASRRQDSPLSHLPGIIPGFED
jgi:hypothetical protein